MHFIMLLVVIYFENKQSNSCSYIVLVSRTLESFFNIEFRYKFDSVLLGDNVKSELGISSFYMFLIAMALR